MSDYATRRSSTKTVSPHEHVLPPDDVRAYSARVFDSVKITDHWTDSDGAIYARAIFRVETFAELSPMLKSVDAQGRKLLLEAVDRAFDELLAEK
jgi:hypothetical protein